MKFMNAENFKIPPGASNDNNSEKNLSRARSKNYVLFNEHGRLRSGWRFLVFQILFAFLYALLGAALLFLFARLFGVSLDGKSVLSFAVPNVVLLAAALLGGWLCARIFESLPFRSLGFWFTKSWLKDSFFGAAIGAVSIAFAVLIGVLFGGMRLQTNEGAGGSAIFLTLGVSFIVFVIAAAAEEALFRGYILQNFSRAKLFWFGAFGTSILFALAHKNNADAGALSLINTFLAGVWFAVAYLKTRNLWFPFGIHLTWNWLQGAFFGLPVSGITSLTTAPFFTQTDKGATLITGGDYGIEGGIACTIAIIVSGVLIYVSPIFKPTEEMLRMSSEENASVKSNRLPVSKSPES